MENTEQVLLDNRLYIHKWEIDKPKAIIVIFHGLAEHGGRYQDHALYLNEAGFNVYAFDHIGHGKSIGSAVYIEKFEEYERDASIALDYFHSLHKDLKIFVWGHSMGGVILTKGLAQDKYKNVSSSIITNTGFDIFTNQPNLLVAMGKLMARLFPKMKMVKLDSKGISSIQEEIDKYDQDPYNYRKGLKPGMIAQLDYAGKWITSNASSFKDSIKVIYSSGDKTVYYPATQKFFSEISSTDKSIKDFPNSRHEIHNDVDREDLLHEIINWINPRI